MSALTNCAALSIAIRASGERRWCSQRDGNERLRELVRAKSNSRVRRADILPKPLSVE
ncbi:MAG: hypothetical protein QOF80_1366 [Verrucomicrobiota bacterium]